MRHTSSPALRLSSSVAKILERVREAPSADYNKRLKLLQGAAQAARALCPQLTCEEDAKSAWPAFVAITSMPLISGCAPQCCEASYVRAVAIEAKCEVLATWKRLDPDAAMELAPLVVIDLVHPSSKRIALATLELIKRSPEACRVHLASLLEALRHPRWHVAEAAAHCLAKLDASVKDSACAPLAEALRHKQWQVRRAAAKALGAISCEKHPSLKRAARYDTHAAVRSTACKALGIRPMKVS